MADPLDLKRELIDVSTLGLRLEAKKLAEGVRGGVHRAARKGAGVEFAGHRPYTPGDDLRHLDRHSLLRHGRWMVREFYTDTERTVHVVVDATISMNYAGAPNGGGSATSPTKLHRAALLAAALALLARRAGDPVGLTVVGQHFGDRPFLTIPARAGAEAEQRFLATLEEVLTSSGSARPEARKPEREGRATPNASPWPDVLGRLAQSLPPGSTSFVFSDFFDFAGPVAPVVASKRPPSETPDTSNSVPLQMLTDLSTRRRSVTCVQTLDPTEVTFPFVGAVQLVDDESGLNVETDASSVKAQYLESLARLTSVLHDGLASRGGAFVRIVTSADPLDTLRQLLAR